MTRVVRRASRWTWHGGVCALGLWAAAPLLAQTPAPTTPLAFANVTVVDVVRGRRVPDQTVLVVGNRIRAIGRAARVRLPAGAHVVDARGKYLIPGLWDMHVHSGVGVLGIDPVTASEVAYRQFIANGVTGFRDAGNPIPLDTLHRWRQEILAGTRIGPPRQILSGQSIADAGEDPASAPPCNRHELQLRGDGQTCVSDSADAVHYVDSLKAAGADMIKPRDVQAKTYFAVAREARRLGIPFGGHLSGLKTAIEASDSGASTIDHIRGWLATNGGLDSACFNAETASVDRCQPIARRFRRNGTWIVPTMVVYAPLFASASKIQRRFTDLMALRSDSLRRPVLNPYDTAHAVVETAPAATHGALYIPGIVNPGGGLALARRLGFQIISGTDAMIWNDGPPWYGFNLHAELAMYVAEGLTPLEALQTATLNPAKFWHATDSLGTVAAGKLADLILLDADPLADITNTERIRGVVANGRYFDRAALDQLLADAKVAGARRKPAP